MRSHARRLSLFVSIGIMSLTIYLSAILGTNVPFYVGCITVLCLLDVGGWTWGAH